MNAYNEMYLDDAMECLGEAFDYAVNSCSIDPDLFLSMFITSDFARRFELGEPQLVSGMSGIELAVEVISSVLGESDLPPARIDYALSREYWAGWILAYAQWRTARSFTNIRRYISMHELLNLYNPFHEADEERFVEELENRIRLAGSSTNLQELRKAVGLTQKELSERSGVNLRTLQQYETRAKDINKASGATIRSLSRAVGCSMEDLLEYDFVA